jgi:hypothetical protein
MWMVSREEGGLRFPIADPATVGLFRDAGWQVERCSDPLALELLARQTTGDRPPSLSLLARLQRFDVR